MANKKASSKSKDGKKHTDSAHMWENFLKEIDEILKDISTSEIKVAALDAKDLETFTKKESDLRKNAEDFGGPPPYTKSPDWPAILSIKPSKSPIQFRTIIYNVLKEQTVSEEEKAIRDINLLQIIHDVFQSTYEDLTANTGGAPNNQETFTLWIETAIIQLEENLGPVKQNQIVHELTKLIFKTTNLDVAPWTEFDNPLPGIGQRSNPLNGTGASPCDDSGSTGIWPERFCSVIWNILDGNPQKEEKALEEETDAILKRLSGALKNYDSKNETSVRNWIETTITGLPSAKLSNFKKEELIADLENAVTQIFPQPDKLYFYTTLQTRLFQNIYNPPPVDPRTAAMLEDIKKQQQIIERAEGRIHDDMIGQIDTGMDTGTGFDTGTGASDKMIALKSESVEALVNSFVKSKKMVFEKNQEKEFKKEVRRLIESGISKTFEDLVDQGTQGELISATYDRQIVSRISDYTTNLLNELSNDLNKDIPKNGSQSLEAAKDITATAVAFNQYAQALVEMFAAYQGEGGNKQGSGDNYQQVKILMEGSTGSQGGSIPDLANAIYLGTGKPEPLVKQSEYYGVQLAATTAGLLTSLQKLLIGEQQDAIKALDTMKSKANAILLEKQTAFKQDADAYFTGLDDYIKYRQEFEIELFNREIIYQSRADLTNIIELGELNYSADSLASLSRTTQ